MDKNKLKKVLFDNKVVVLFAVLCVIGFATSGQTFTYLFGELFSRIARNTFLVLALIIPVLAGLGLNFGIVLGAMSAQLALFWTTHWGLVGLSGFLLTILLATPIAIFLGFLVGKLFNKMKGTEMIGGLILGYFAEGFYQFIFIFVLGGIIPIANTVLMDASGVGVTNTIDLTSTIKYALDDVPLLTVIEIAFYVIVVLTVLVTAVKIVRKQKVDYIKTGLYLISAIVIYALTYIPVVESALSQDRVLLLTAIEYGIVLVIAYTIVSSLYRKFVAKVELNVKKIVVRLVLVVVIYALTYIPSIYDACRLTRLPMFTYLCIAGVCVFNAKLLNTKLGQEMRAVGQNRVVANAAGIDVDRTRIIAMIISTVLASWGQLVYLQNIGTFATYGAHTNTALYAIAALLVGGASVQKANNKQALIGIVLFHTLFVVAPAAGNQLFGNAAIGEYFRVFVSYGVIAMALAMHAWKAVKKK